MSISNATQRPCRSGIPYAKLALTACRWVLLAVAFSSPAYAYIDPGSSLLLLQGLFAGIGAALTLIRKPWKLLAKLFSRLKKTDDA
jgi:hypothetical protein